MIDLAGRSRVLIENVQPQVDGGLYPAKRTIGERVDVTADIFGDGHDHIRAQVWYRKEGATDWTVDEMIHQGNDLWKGIFFVSEKGNYQFTVVAWMDHLDTWYDGFKKKVGAAVNVSVELQEGAIMLRKLAAGSNHSLLQAAQKLETSYSDAVAFVMSAEFEALVHQYPLVEFETIYGQVLTVSVEHKKANFSTWYELFPRSASLEGKHGTFKDVMKLLPRVSSMGFDVLYLPPIHPIGKVNRKGKK